MSILVDGTRVVTASSDRTVRVWDVSRGRELIQLRGSGGDVYGARFSADGTRIVTASGDHKVRVWNALTGTQILRFDVSGDAFDAAFTHDGRSLVVACMMVTFRCLVYLGPPKVVKNSWAVSAVENSIISKRSVSRRP